jgi:hypothetical protein
VERPHQALLELELVVTRLRLPSSVTQTTSRFCEEVAVPGIDESGLVAQQETRFAVVLNGGVSLAVWMGGAAQELNLLTWSMGRGRHPTPRSWP